MAKLGSVAKSDAKELASLWGNTFGHTSDSVVGYQHTVGIMKQILMGDTEKGIPAYTREDVELAIEQLRIACQDRLVEVRSPGLIKWVIAKVVAGTFLSEQKSKIKRVRIL